MSDSTKKAVGIVAGFMVLIVALVGGITIFPSASNEGYQPKQPIPFSHKLHAGINKIDCRYCHYNVEKSRHATIPPVGLCMNCHSIVKTDSPHIQKIHEHFKNGTPIEWIRVHEEPDFVQFSHKPHIARGVSCQTCHGDVQSMETLYQAKPLTMGWCLDCHRGQTTPPNVLKNVFPDVENPHGLQVAPTNCSTCHY